MKIFKYICHFKGHKFKLIADLGVYEQYECKRCQELKSNVKQYPYAKSNPNRIIKHLRGK